MMDTTWTCGSAKDQKRLRGVVRLLNQQLMGRNVVVTEWEPPARRLDHTTFLVPGRPFVLDLSMEEPAVIMPIGPDYGTRISLGRIRQDNFDLRAEIKTSDGKCQICTPVNVPHHAPMYRRYEFRTVD